MSSRPSPPSAQKRAPPTSPPPRRMKRARYRGARAFYLTLLLGACLFAYSRFTLNNHARDKIISRRSDQPPLHPQSADEDCRFVHKSADQCHYIHHRCPTDDAAFTFLLDIYYCQLPHLHILAIILLWLWLGLLFSTIGIAASDFFCINLSTIASILGMSESMAGVTFLAFGNGSPDVFSTFAAMSSNSGSLAVGELFGAAGFITAVVAGSMALVRPFHVARKSFIRDVGFFAVAAAFSMVFLWDGRLQLWECIAMVAFYIIYVAFVVAWHWWIGRRRRRREKEAAARGHFLAPGDELDVEGEYHDDPEEAAAARRSSVHRGVSIEDWSALENAGPPYVDGGLDEDEEEEARDRWMSELSSNMRLTRPGVRSRKNTISNVRPSLVGALEFQAVMKSLQKSRNIQTIPLHARRYSDDPSFTTAQQQERMSSLEDPAARPPFQITVDGGGSPVVERPALDLEVPKSAPGRMRAVSANDASSLQIDPEFGRSLTRAPSPSHSQSDLIGFADTQQKSPTHLTIPGHTSPSLQITPAAQEPQDKNDLHIDTSMASTSHLTPQPSPNMFRTTSDHFAPKSILRSPHTTTETPHESPRTVPTARSLPRIMIPRSASHRSQDSSRASSPFPRYHDDPTATAGGSGTISRSASSLRLPPPSIASPESLPISQSAEQETLFAVDPPSPRWKYWPYTLLPPPGVIISTFFPTIYHWGGKTWWEKCLGVSALPSVLVLTLTLPVVENESDKEEEEEEEAEEVVGGQRKDGSYGSARSKSLGGVQSDGVGVGVGGGKGGVREDVVENGNGHPGHTSLEVGAGVAGLAADTEWHYRHNAGDHDTHHHQDNHHHHHYNIERTASPTPHYPDPPTPEPWNRWLTILHLYTSPLFCLLAIYIQYPDDDLTPLWLLQPSLISLLLSTTLLIPLLLTTTPTYRPRPYIYLLSTAGFIVSIAWISTVATQVVSALKALAIFWNMSHAIMGLTIFAVGNSLGDLVADITVARLGYPVMALSACFGGPMLNILLGIGVSGSYILISGADERHREHPGEDHLHFKSYHIDVSTTLIISGATLLVTLVGLLVAVPMNKWVFDRKIGWALAGLWAVSTVGNVVVEVLGVGEVG
ncbi:hypothetical protein LTR78_010032 [Recurvomyces mirabilis]|uniref:Sodium/calcium exchanger membrane region domain-containing protein n=1 Tax=Recurvomyces mirabilis TaxID=574656 RepID=A0AAE0TQS8_9PEZI|nr:hypothetical protein LTR78_010032 [Recurvomyces mirabilis]KAK5149813.1 hypothetical protein LTS14_010634 [Recurvomyces mirabilis]